jgi:hypothetical protein
MVAAWSRSQLIDNPQKQGIVNRKCTALDPSATFGTFEFNVICDLPTGQDGSGVNAHDPAQNKTKPNSPLEEFVTCNLHHNMRQNEILVIWDLEQCLTPLREIGLRFPLPTFVHIVSFNRLSATSSNRVIRIYFLIYLKF